MKGEPAGAPLELEGGPHERGAAQARLAPDAGDAVRAAVALRLAMARARLESPQTKAFLDAQWEFHRGEAADCLDEMRGVAHGYAIDERELFAYLHLGVIDDLAEGCTAWARSDTGHGAVLAKNRDFRGEHAGLQRLFRHRDPAWNGQRVLAVGSLGSPGVYSSGINTSGLALADTAVGTSDHGVGLLRYFLMSRILARAASVDEALAIVEQTTHAGGGTLVLADASGSVAAVELGHRQSAVERAAPGAVARTNRFVDPAMVEAWRPASGDPLAANSQQRRAHVTESIAQWPATIAIERAFELMGRHDSAGHAGLCRHSDGAEARTISCAVFALSPPTLYFSDSAPCSGSRVRANP